MQKLFLLAYLCLSIISVHLIFADDGSATSVNSSNFMVDLSKMDPLGDNTTERKTPPHGMESFIEILGSITDILLMLIPIIAGVSFLIAGYFYIFSAGDSEKAGRAKTIIKWNIVAIFVALLSYSIMSIVVSFFNT